MAIDNRIIISWLNRVSTDGTADQYKRLRLHVREMAGPQALSEWPVGALGDPEQLGDDIWTVASEFTEETQRKGRFTLDWVVDERTATLVPGKTFRIDYHASKHTDASPEGQVTSAQAHAQAMAALHIDASQRSMERLESIIDKQAKLIDRFVQREDALLQREAELVQNGGAASSDAEMIVAQAKAEGVELVSKFLTHDKTMDTLLSGLTRALGPGKEK